MVKTSTEGKMVLGSGVGGGWSNVEEEVNPFRFVPSLGDEERSKHSGCPVATRRCEVRMKLSCACLSVLYIQAIRFADGLEHIAEYPSPGAQPHGSLERRFPRLWFHVTSLVAVLWTPKWCKVYEISCWQI
jgi:hypothetical protein